MKNRFTSFISYIAAALPLLMIYSLPARAEYTFELVNPPGALYIQAFGINSQGIVTGNADDGEAAFGFAYDSKSGEYTKNSDGFRALDISNSGVMVGNVDDICAMRDQTGNVTEFFPPSFGAGSSCQARGVNSNGKVSGFEVDADGIFLGFVYDSNSGTYEEFLPSAWTITHALNAQGQNVGSVRLETDQAFPGSPAGHYGYLREKDGAVKYFAISQSAPGQSRARGISESGVVAGWYVESPAFEAKSYVTTLSSGSAFEQIALTDDQVLYRKPCNPDVAPPPGPGYESFTDVIASQIRNDGVVVGTCTDGYFNPVTLDLVTYSAGFIATPIH